VFWLPRYFRYSIEAKTSQIHKDRRRQKLYRLIHVFVKKFFKVLKNEKKSEERMKGEVYGENKEVGNIEKNVFVVFGIFLKQVKKKENPWLLTTNDSTNMLTS